ncbi:phosphoribosyltransferase [Aquicella lusitana]|nr:phosphoribosyltransferase [Aquicella lusitana]
MERYRNRKEAGKILARALSAYAGQDDVIVLALPRGGVPVAFEIAKALQAPLDVFIVRKLGVPGHSELAMGAIATGGTAVFNEDIVEHLQIPESAIQAVIAEEKQELNRRNAAYRGSQPFPSLKEKIIILVDDGIATGATVRAAINALKQQKPKKIILAVPVADPSLCEKLQLMVDELYCPLKPSSLYAVGAWYEDFSQTEDEEVYTLLKEAKQLKKNGNKI